MPFRCHWKLSGGLPLADAVKVAGSPTLTVWLAGWVVIVGARLPVYVIR